MIRFKVATVWPVMVLFAIIFFAGCKKDLQEIPLSENTGKLPGRSISLEEVKGRFASNGGGAHDR